VTGRDAPAPYTLRQVQELVGLTPAVARALVDKGFVAPARGARRELRFTFQDLLLMKTADALRRAQVPTRRILAALETLRAGLPQDVPLTGLRITAEGAHVAVRDAAGMREPTTGQLLLDFEVRGSPEAAVSLVVADRLVARGQAPAPLDRFEEARALESVDRARAEAAYRAVIAADPSRVEAHVNLGALLCEDGRFADAVRLFDAALAHGLRDPLLQFNRGVALEDAGEPGRAAEAYEAALALDPALADAHYNLALLLEQRGDGQGALRHLSAYRRLSAPAS